MRFQETRSDKSLKIEMVILIGNRLSCEVANDLGYASQPFHCNNTAFLPNREIFLNFSPNLTVSARFSAIFLKKQGLSRNKQLKNIGNGTYQY